MKTKLHRTLTALLILALLLPMGAHAFEMEDVSPDDWFYRYVMRGLDFGLITGTSGDSFRFEPNRPVTWAEFVTMLGRLHEYQDGNSISNPADGTFYGRYLTWAVEHGIVLGNQHGDLMPRILITREQMAVMVYRYIDAFELQRHLPPQRNHNTVPVDYQDISSWARHDVVQMMFSYGLMWGTSRLPILFNPQANSTRAEALTVLVRLGDVLYDATRFVVTVTVEETSLPQGEPFIVNIELRNNSGEDHEIRYFYGRLFRPIIQDWWPLPVHPEIRSRFFEANNVIRNARSGGDESRSWSIFPNLEPGTHELKVGAGFWLNFGQENEQFITVWSDPIMLTVQ